MAGYVSPLTRPGFGVKKKTRPHVAPVAPIKTPRTNARAGAPRPTPVANPAPPPAPATVAPPTPVVTGPPMPTLQSTADRTAANYDYGVTMGDVNRQLRDLAAGYGGAPQVTQFGYNPDQPGSDSQSMLGVTPDQPGSTTEVLSRNLGLTKGGIDQTANNANTYFSGLRLTNLGNADKDYQGQLADAQRAYESAMGQLITAMTGARGTRNQNLTNADIADIQAAAARQPEAQQVAAPEVAPPGGPPPPNEGGPAYSAWVNGPHEGSPLPQNTWDAIAQWHNQSLTPKKPKRKK